jgi:hypothetical protein
VTRGHERDDRAVAADLPDDASLIMETLMEIRGVLFDIHRLRLEEGDEEEDEG